MLILFTLRRVLLIHRVKIRLIFPSANTSDNVENVENESHNCTADAALSLFLSLRHDGKGLDPRSRLGKYRV